MFPWNPYVLPISIILILTLMSTVKVQGIIIMVEGKECYYQSATVGDVLTGSFVVIDFDSPWRDEDSYINFKIQHPDGTVFLESNRKTEQTFEFQASYTGDYGFCLEQQSYYVATVELNFRLAHIEVMDYKSLATEGRMEDLTSRLITLNYDLGIIQQDQAYFRAQGHRRKKLNEGTNRRMIYFAVLETVVIVGAAVLQVYILIALFEKKHKQ